MMIGFHRETIFDLTINKIIERYFKRFMITVSIICLPLLVLGFSKYISFELIWALLIILFIIFVPKKLIEKRIRWIVVSFLLVQLFVSAYIVTIKNYKLFNHTFDFLIKNFGAEILVTLIISFFALVRKLWVSQHKTKLMDKHELKIESLVWSPDKQSVCFIIGDRDKRELNILDVNKQKNIKIEIRKAKDQTPVWSPNGDKIALVSFKDGKNEIYIINVDGTNFQKVTEQELEALIPQKIDVSENDV